MADALIYTSDEEFNLFQPEERGIDITGFVDSIDGLRSVRTAQGHVFKFVVNNGSSTRIRVLIWGTRAARRYEAEIRVNSIVEILGGTLKGVDSRYRDPETFRLEYHVQPASVITLHGQHIAEKRQLTFQPVTFNQLMNTPGPVEIEAFVRSRFRQVQTAYSSFGQGMVADGIHRLTVNIAAYEDNPRLNVGVAIKLRGEMDLRQGFFKITDMDNVEIREDVLPMSRANLALSFRPVIVAIPEDPVVPVRRQRLDENGVGRGGVDGGGIGQGGVGPGGVLGGIGDGQ